jgi:hypothetical protein
MAASSATAPASTGNAPAPEPAARFQWQCQAGWGNSWTDYDQGENQLLEAAWRRQLWMEEEVVITMPGWGQHVIYLGSRLQQINFVTGRSRALRRIQIIEQGLRGGWTSNLRSETEEEDSPTSEAL